MAKEAVKIQEGGVIDYTAGATIANGDVIPFAAGRIGVALDDAVSGDTISVAIEGVFEITAATADEIAVGAEVYFDATNRVLTTTSTDNTLAGMATTAKAAAAAGSVYVKIG